MGKSKVKTASKSGLVRTQYERRKRQPNEYKPKVAEVMYGKGYRFWRLYEIHRLISWGSIPPVYLVEIGAQATVERDIERLRDLFGAPIQYDRNKKGYCYTQPYSLPPVRLREGEAIALFLGQKLLAQCKGTPLEEFVENAMLKIRMLLPQEVDVSLERAVEAVSFHVDPLRGEEVEEAQNYYTR